MGEKAGNTSLNALSNFDNELWQRISTLNCTGTPTSENIDNQQFSLFQNPTKDVLNLQFNQEFIHFNGQIIDINGRILKTFNNQKTVDISDLPIGFYAVKVVNTEGVLFGQKTFVKM
jgi:hypothetical protein